MTSQAIDSARVTGRSIDSVLHRLPVDFERLAGLVTTAGGEREFQTVRAPFNGAALGRVPLCTGEDVLAAVERARTAQKVWSRRSFTERQRIFLRLHDIVLQRQDELMDLLQLETGKARMDAMEEVLDVANNCRYYGYRARKFLKPRKRKGALPLLTAAWEHRHPVGVVGVIAPWNYPLTLAISDALPAMLAGNTIVLKPASLTPFTALYAMKLLRDAGLPYEVFQVVTGSGSQVGQPLIENIDFLQFTGSTSTGRQVAQTAGERLIGYSMELGGKNPILVMEDADVEKAVSGIIRGSFANTGQLCIAFERLYVHRSLYNRLVDWLVQSTHDLKLGAALDFSADVGSLISQEQLEKTREHVEDARSKGAAVLAGGRARPDLGPYFYEPTLLAGVTPEMAVFAEETFGPVLSIYPFDREDEAVKMANDTQYGLNAAIWTRDSARARRLAQKIETGTVNINEAYWAAWGSVDGPMGGFKASGVGRRHGREGIQKYTQSQTVADQRLIPLAPFGGIRPRTFALLMSLTLQAMKRIPGLR